MSKTGSLGHEEGQATVLKGGHLSNEDAILRTQPEIVIMLLPSLIPRITSMIKILPVAVLVFL